MATAMHKRIEILVDAPLVARIAAACEVAGISGHTVIPTLSGSGRSGQWSSEHVTDAEYKVLIIALGSASKIDALVEALTPVLDSHGVMLSISDVTVVRSDRFD